MKALMKCAFVVSLVSHLLIFRAAVPIFPLCAVLEVGRPLEKLSPEKPRLAPRTRLALLRSSQLEIYREKELLRCKLHICRACIHTYKDNAAGSIPCIYTGVYIYILLAYVYR